MANAKLDIDISAFNANVNTAKGILKGLDAEMKATDATFKATGNSEKQLADKTKVLNSQIRVQKGIIDQAKQALDALSKQGVAEADAEYQKWYATLMKATAGMNNAQAELNALNSSTLEAASGADQLTSSMNGISKKISLDQVISGIDKITSSLETAAKKAVELGKDLWNSIMDSARLSDDIATQARVFDMTPEMYQRYKGVFDTIGEVTMQEWASVRRKIEKAMEDPSNDQIDIIKALGFGGMVGGKGSVTEEDIRLTADNWEDAFWGVATELKRRVESGEISLATADVWGEAMFGKKYSNLKTLIDMGQEEFVKALDTQNVASDEAVEKNASLNDAVIKLQESYEALKMEVTSGLAPALTSAATALDGLLGKILEYLQTEEGQQMLSDLGESVAELFSGLKDINPQDIVNGFKGVFDTVLGALDWIVKNKDTLIAAVEGIFGVWATLEVSSGVLTILKVIDGLKSLAGLGAGAGATVSTGISGLLTGATTAVAGIAGNGVLQNFIPGLSDWIVHNTGIGQEVFLGTKEKGSTFKEIGENTEQWWNDYKNVLTNARDYWSGIMDQQREAAEWTFGDEYTADELMQMINGGEPVKVEVEPTPEEGAAENIADQVGTITLPVEFQIRSDYANLQGYILKQLTGHANGLSYVPNEGLYHLHRGERVVPAREVASRSFSSNLYVENMNMGGSMSADALAAAIAGRNRRLMAGYGS